MTLLQPRFPSINSSRLTENKLTALIAGDYRFWIYRTITNDGVRDDVVEARRTIQLGPEGTITLCDRPRGDFLTLPIDDLSDKCKGWVNEMDRKAAAQRSDAETVQTPTQRPTRKPAAAKPSQAARKEPNRISRQENAPAIHLKRKTRIMRFALWANGKKVERWVTVDNGWAPVIDLTGEDESEEGAAVDEQVDNLLRAVEMGE